MLLVALPLSLLLSCRVLADSQRPSHATAGASHDRRHLGDELTTGAAPRSSSRETDVDSPDEGRAYVMIMGGKQKLLDAE